MREGDVVLAPLAQADGAVKIRPAIFLRAFPQYRDVLLAGISTKLQREIPGLDELLVPGDPDFDDSGLRSPSVIRLSFLGMSPENQLCGGIGRISPDRHRRLLTKLSDFLRPA